MIEKLALQKMKAELDNEEPMHPVKSQPYTETSLMRIVVMLD